MSDTFYRAEEKSPKRIVCAASNSSQTIFLDPFKDLLLNYNGYCRLWPSSIPDRWQHKALVPQWASCILYSLGSTQNSKQQHSGGSKTFLPSALFSIGSVLRKEKHQRLSGKGQPNQHSTDRLGHHGSAALFTTARKCNQPRYPWTDEPGKEPNIYTGQFYLAIKKSQYLQEMERKGNHHDTQHKPGSGKPHFGSFGFCVGMDVCVCVHTLDGNKLKT